MRLLSVYVWCVVCAAWALLFSAIAAASTDHDFQIVFNDCRITVGYLSAARYPLKTVDTSGMTVSCTRNRRKFSCNMVFKDNSAPMLAHKFNLSMETGGIFDIKTPDGSTHIAVNSVTHAAVLFARASNLDYLGGKVCSGIYSTADEGSFLSK